jgi:hypothetical protein
VTCGRVGMERGDKAAGEQQLSSGGSAAIKGRPFGFTPPGTGKSPGPLVMRGKEGPGPREATA